MSSAPLNERISRWIFCFPRLLCCGVLPHLDCQPLAPFSFYVAHSFVLRSSHACALWLRYLQFKASHFASFSVSSQRSIFARCIGALQSKREDAITAEEQEQRTKGVFIMVSVLSLQAISFLLTLQHLHFFSFNFTHSAAAFVVVVVLNLSWKCYLSPGVREWLETRRGFLLC